MSEETAEHQLTPCGQLRDGRDSTEGGFVEVQVSRVLQERRVKANANRARW